MELHVFTDGACKSNGKHGAKASYAGWFPSNKELSFSRLLPENESQTNQRAELRGIHDSVKILYDQKLFDIHLKIFTDSLYSKNCLSIWINSWIQKGWKTTDGSQVKHRDLIEPLNDMLKSFKEYSIIHVKAHTGKQDYNSLNNDIVDKMAGELLVDKSINQEINRNENLMPDLQLSLMGPPLEEQTIFEWCKTHLDLLDSSALKTGLFSAFQKTMKKNGYILELQMINKQKFVRVSANKLIQDTGIIG